MTPGRMFPAVADRMDGHSPSFVSQFERQGCKFRATGLQVEGFVYGRALDTRKLVASSFVVWSIDAFDISVLPPTDVPENERERPIL